jgi:hypothetical protein
MGQSELWPKTCLTGEVTASLRNLIAAAEQVRAAADT